MMLLGLFLAAAPLAPGCRSAGPSVHCLLDAPKAVAVPSAAPVRTVSLSARPVEPARPEPVRRPAARTVERATPARPPLDEAGIGRHADSLVAIGDCTGARTFLTSVGRTDQAAELFANCVGGGATVAYPAAATVASTR